MTEILRGAFLDRMPVDQSKPHLSVDWSDIGIGDGFEATGTSYAAVKAHASRMGAVLGRGFRTTQCDDGTILVWRIA